MDINLLGTFALLVGLELVLGIDNVLLISILTDRLPEEKRAVARYVGLGLALFARLALLLGVSTLIAMKEAVFFGFSWKDLILLSGGGFLLFKAVKEIHHVVEHKHALDVKTSQTSFSGTIFQVVLLDIVFSIDSIITAVGLTNSLLVIYLAVIASFVLVLIFSGPIARFVQAHATLKILALSFLVTIGVTLCLEGFQGHVPKAYIYLPMAFALAVELLQMRYDRNRKRVSSKS